MMRGAWLLVALVGAAVPFAEHRRAISPPAAARAEDELETWISALDAGTEPGWTEAFEELSALGEPAALRALRDFSSADFAARRSRARLVVELASPACIDGVLALAGDPDPEVRRLFLSFFGSLALGEQRSDERTACLEKSSRDDPEERVRVEAVEALVRSALPGAVAALDRLLSELPPAEGRKVARALAELPGARARLVARVEEALLGASGLEDTLLVQLLNGYGRSLAELEKGGLDERERAAFLLARSHPSIDVQRAARRALAALCARLNELGEPERAETILSALEREGWEHTECQRRRFDLALLGRGDADAALEIARTLRADARFDEADVGLAWQVEGLFLEGACLFARGDRRAAGAAFSTAEAKLAAMSAERSDLFPDSAAEVLSIQGGALRAERLQLLALLQVWQTAIAIQDTGIAGPKELARLRAAHELVLRSRVVALRTGAPQDSATFDELFDHALSPQTLLSFNDRLTEKTVPGWDRRRALDLELVLGRAVATVTPFELPGLEPLATDDRVLSDPLFDPARRAALEAFREAMIESVNRELKQLEREPSPDTLYVRILRQHRFELDRSAQEERARLAAIGGAERLSPVELREVLSSLARTLAPSLFGLSLARELRAEGRPQDARELLTRMLADLRTGLPGASDVWTGYVTAQVQDAIGSTWMDDERPNEAEQACLEAVRGLEALENTLGELRDGGRVSRNSAQADAQIREIQTLRSNALLSLAVNANVRMGNPARALEFFERAYELDQKPFMQVLRACYRARSGRADEARAVLRTVVPAPSLYYNLACTHALLGEPDVALDYLERDLTANYPSPGARKRQSEWARKDPDLKSLRENSRFQRLIEAR